MKDRKLIRNFYKSRFIDSLEKDYDKWSYQHYGACNGDSWVEWHGPEYTNDDGEKIKFFFGLNYTGAYINGQVGYTIGTFEWLFGENSRRLRKAYKRMKNHVSYKQEKERNEKLIKAL